MASGAFYEAYVSIIPESKGFRKALSNEFDAAGTDGGKRAGRGLNAGILGGIGSLAGPIAGAIAAIGIGKMFKDAVVNASDFNEAGTAITAVFGDADKTIQAFAKSSAAALGQSTNATLDAARVFGTFGKAAGLSGESLADFSTEFITLSADLASFNNTTPEQAIEALGAGLRGESEPLRAYGILLDDAALKARATTLGIYSGTGALTQQQKVLASQAEILAQTNIQQGDFARTSGGLANQQRILSAGLANLSSAFGTLLLPVVLAVVGVLNTKLVPALTTVVDSFKFVIGYISGEGANVDIGWLEGPATAIADAFLTMKATVDFVLGYISGAGANVDIGWLEGPATAIGEAFLLLKSVVEGLGPTFLTFFTDLSPVRMLLEQLQPFLPVLIDAFTQVGATLVGSLGPALATVFSSIGELLPSIIDGVTELLPALASLVTAILPVLADLIVQLLPPLVELIVNALPGVIAFIVFLSEALTNIAPVIGFIAGLLGGLIGILGTPTQTVFNNLADFFMNFGPVGEFFAGILRNIGSLLKEGLGGAFAIVTEKIGETLGVLGGLGSSALAAIGDLGSTLFSAGKALIDGFIGGIKDSLGGVGDAIGGVMDFAAGFFPHSPAKRGPFSGAGWTAVKTAGLAIGDQFSAGLGAAQSQLDLSMASLVSPNIAAPRIDASVGAFAAAAVQPGGGLGAITQYNTFDHMPPEVAVEMAGQRLTSAARRARV